MVPQTPGNTHDVIQHVVSWKVTWTCWPVWTVNFLFSGNAPNYYPNSFSGPVDNAAKLECPIHISGDVQRYNTADDDNFTQVGAFWKKVGGPSGTG